MHIVPNHTTETITGPLVNNGVISVRGGTLDIYGPVTGTGHIDITNHGRVILHDAVATSETINVGTGTVEFFGPVARMSFLGSIGHFTAASTIQADDSYPGGNGVVGLKDVTRDGAMLALVPTPNVNMLPIHLLGHFQPTAYVGGVLHNDVLLTHGAGNDALITLARS